MVPASSPAPSGAGPPAARPVARLRRPGEMAAVVPMLCGFVPAESLVVVALQGTRSRIGLTMRIDLPDRRMHSALVEEVLARLSLAGAAGALLVVYTSAADVADELPRAELVAALAAGCRSAGRDVADALLVREGRWWSYVCRDRSCCPPGGAPLDAQVSGSVALVAAEQAWDGRAVLPSRAALGACVLPAIGERAEAAARALVAVELHRTRAVAAEGRAAAGRRDLLLWRHALSRVPLPGDEAREVAPALVASLSDRLVRDEVLTWALEDEGSPLLAVLLWLVGECGPPSDAPLCSTLAWVAHCRGDGALANVALDRALSSDPSYSMAVLGRQVLDAQVSPQRMRAVLADSRRVLHRQHPWTRCQDPDPP